MPRLDYYRVLGVSRDTSDDEIKKAYRKLVFQHHPDHNPNNTHAEAKIREINSAYEVLGDPESGGPMIGCIGGRKRLGMKPSIRPSFSTRWRRSFSTKAERNVCGLDESRAANQSGTGRDP